MQPHFPTIWLCAMILAGSAVAQTSRGSLSGRAVDAAGAVLKGARIELTPSGRSAVSDGQGEFNISNLPAGNYKVTASYVGFSSFAKDVAVIASQTVRVDAVLEVSASTQEVTVYAERQHGEAETPTSFCHAIHVILKGAALLERSPSIYDDPSSIKFQATRRVSDERQL